MRNVLQAIDYVWQHLRGGLLSTEITGEIYKNQRPTGSQKEDIVISCLGLNSEKLQQGVINVNVHVPQITISQNAVTDEYPDHTRLLALTGIALSELEEVWDPEAGWAFEVEQHNLFNDQGETYINIRLAFAAINNSNKH